MYFCDLSVKMGKQYPFAMGPADQTTRKCNRLILIGVIQNDSIAYDLHRNANIPRCYLKKK
jgi:hypothetical protein